MLATKLSSALVAPAKVANLLDWGKAAKSVMALDITRKGIGIAITEHPEHICESIPLQPISLLPPPQVNQGEWSSSSVNKDDRIIKRSQVNKELISELEAIVRQHRVCAFVVNYPLHEGRMGEQCGKVLQVLDSVIDQSNSVVTRKRPFTLWCNYDDNNTSSSSSSSSSIDSSSPLDEWGRSPAFARAPTYVPGMRYSSKSAIESSSSLESSSLVAANILDQWVKNHWEIDTKIGRATAPKKSTDFFFSTHSVDEYNSDKSCLQSALLC